MFWLIRVFIVSLIRRARVAVGRTVFIAYKAPPGEVGGWRGVIETPAGRTLAFVDKEWRIQYRF